MILASARHQWDEGTRGLESVGPGSARHRQLVALVEAVTDELRRRVGQTFTLAELAEAYDGAEDWVREVVMRSTPPAEGASENEGGGTEAAPAGVRDTALVQDAAFGLYARGAVDYRP